MESHPDEGYIEVELTKFGAGEIRYTLDGSDPMQGIIYTEPIHLTESCDLRAIVVREQGNGREYSTHFDFSQLTMKPIILNHEPSPSYTFGGASTLNDGLKGNGNYRTGRWLGFWECPCEAVFDLKGSKELSRLRFNVNINKGDWIYNPKSASVYVSNDGSYFEEIAHADYPIVAQDEKDGVQTYELNSIP